MPVQIEPETPGGMRVRMMPWCAVTVLVPEGQDIRWPASAQAGGVRTTNCNGVALEPP
jgi:hypothetical protein